MKRRLALAAFIILAAAPFASRSAAATCDGISASELSRLNAIRQPDKEQGTLRLAARLPDLAPTTSEVGDVFGSRYVERFQARFCSDLQLRGVAAKNDSDFAGMLTQFSPTGRVQGFAATYGQNPGFSVGVYIMLYESDAAAQQALLGPSLYGGSGPDVAIPQVGDASRSWALGTLGTEPGCMCPLRFRVGPFVVETLDSYHVPQHTRAPDQPAMDIAKLIAEKMRAALAE